MTYRVEIQIRSELKIRKIITETTTKTKVKITKKKWLTLKKYSNKRFSLISLKKKLNKLIKL